MPGLFPSSLRATRDPTLQRSDDSPGAGVLWSAQLAHFSALIIEDRRWAERKAAQTVDLTRSGSYKGKDSILLSSQPEGLQVQLLRHATRQAY